MNFARATGSQHAKGIPRSAVGININASSVVGGRIRESSGASPIAAKSKPKPQDPTIEYGRVELMRAFKDVTARVTRYARKVFNFKTAQLAYSGARDGYPPYW